REVALEPEPGMLVETIDDWKRLAADMRYGDTLYLALDAGHCLVTQERDPAEAVREMSGWLGTVSLEDMKRGRHEHLPFGQGDMDIGAVLEALAEIGFGRLVCVELSRESHRAHEAKPQAIAYLRNLERSSL